MQEQELFQQYELKGWQFSPRLYKIIGAAALTNLLIFTLMAQANFLTGKTCDSAVASGVCSVIDALYMGSIIATTGTDYIDEAYEKIDLENEEITFVEYSEPLKYPEGYFAIANPEQQPLVMDAYTPTPMDMTGIPTNGSNPTIINPTPDLTTATPNFPTPSKNASKKDFPTSPFGTVNNPNLAKNNRKNNNKPNPTLDDVNKPAEDKDTTKEDETAVQSDKIEEVEINRKPLQDLADMVLAQWAAKEVDLNQQFMVVMNGELTKEGRLDTKKSKWDTKQEQGDAKMVEIAKEAVESVGESGWLTYLRNFGIEKIKITLVQDNDKIVALVESEQKTAQRAGTLASQFNALIQGAKLGIKGQDEKTLLSSAKPPTSNGKVFVLSFEIPKPTAQEMINRKLQEAQTKKQQQPTGTSQNVNPNPTAK